MFSNRANRSALMKQSVVTFSPVENVRLQVVTFASGVKPTELQFKKKKVTSSGKCLKLEPFTKSLGESHCQQDLVWDGSREMVVCVWGWGTGECPSVGVAVNVAVQGSSADL